jgi:hypothetical protein
MGCPHLDDSIERDFSTCRTCGQFFCEACFATHSCGAAGPGAFASELDVAPGGGDGVELSREELRRRDAAMRGDDYVELTEEDLREIEAFWKQAEEEASEEVPVGNAQLARATADSLMSAEPQTRPSFPATALSPGQDGGVQTVALNAVTTLAKPVPSPREYPLRCLLWNVANLGGKFGYPKVRDDSVVDATAHIIHAADADVVVILELLGRGTGERPPKEPVKPAVRGAREASNPLLDTLLGAFGVGQSGKAMESLLGVIGRYFADRVQGAIWPKAASDVTALVEQAKSFREAGSGHTLDVLLDRAWNTVCKPLLAGLSPDAEAEDGEAASGDPVDNDTLAATVASQSKNKRKRAPRGEGNQDHLMLRDLAPTLRGGILLLRVEGYTHWLESYAANYSKNDGSDGVSKEEGKRRDAACKKILEILTEGCRSLWVQFLRDIVGDEVTEEERAKWEEREGPRAQYESRVWMGCWNLLVRANEKAMTADYERRLERWKKRHGKSDGKATKHDGVREFLRIRDALNALASDAYASWPDKVPDDTDKSLYTQGETYGLLWKKATVTPALDQVAFISAFASEFEFSKRQPLRFPVQLKKAPSGPAIALVPWHAPAPSQANATARSKDFPTFVRYCEAERKAKRLGVLLSDLNVNTVSGSTVVEHCDGRLQVGALFQGISGRAEASSVFPDQVGTQSTLAVSNFRPWLVPDLLQQDAPTVKLARDVTQALQTKFVQGRFKSAQGLLDFIQGFHKDFTPQHRMSASAYDKILPICGRADRWRLTYASSWAIPFPHALALKEEAEFFRATEQLPPRLQKFAFLLATKAPETLQALRAYAERKARAAKLEDLMQVARELSDHLPVVAELRLVDTESAAEEDAVEEPVQLFSAEPATSGSEAELEKWATAYERAEALPEREKALEALLDWWNKTYEKASPPAAQQRRFERALQKWDSVVENRAKQTDDDSRQASRPALTKKEEPRKKEDKKTLAIHLQTSALATRPNAGGGDCLFRSIAQLVFGDENRHDEVRQACVNHLEDLLAGRSLDVGGRVGDVAHAEFVERLGQLHDWHRAQWPNALAYRRILGVDRWRQFCLGMSRGGEWGDLIILCAASHLLGVRFRVYVQVVGGFYSDEVDFVDRTRLGRPELVLVNYGNYHFVAVTPTAREALIDDRVGTPAGWEALRVRRDRAPAPPPPARQEPPPEPGQDKGVASGGSSASPPSPSGPVFQWPSGTSWTLADALGAPTCLFLFGENDADKGSRKLQLTTQACIRPAPNAAGIRTCWKPGADVSEGGAMLDTELDRNRKAIDQDFEEARQLLLTGAYTTLVVPWDTAKGRPALGIGVAQLPERAKQTYAHLCQRTEELMKWAQASLGKVLVCPRATGLTVDICKPDPESLYVHEVGCGLDRPDSLDFWMAIEAVLALPNVKPVRTGHNPFSPIQDAKLAENTRLLGLDFDVIENALKTGRFRRVVLPEGSRALGHEARLETTAPQTHAYVQKRVKQLLDLCATTAAPALSSPPVQVVSPPKSPPPSFESEPARTAAVPVDQAERGDPDERPVKARKVDKAQDVPRAVSSQEEEDREPPSSEVAESSSVSKRQKTRHD